MTQSLNSAPQKQKFSVAINSKMYQNLIASTLRDPARARRFSAAITSAVAVNPALQECDAGTILAGALLGESLNLSPSPQLGQYYLVPFKQKAKYDRDGNMIRPETTTATFVLGYKGYIQLAIRSGQYKDLEAMRIGAFCYVLAGFSHGGAYCIPWSVWRSMKEHYGRKYITENDITQYKIPRTTTGMLAILGTGKE